MPELRIIPVGVEQRVRAIRLHHLTVGDRGGQPAVVGLASELQDPFPRALRSKREVPSATPQRGSRRRRARQRAGTSFSRQVRLRQVHRRTPQHLILLLQQPDPPPNLPQFCGLGSRLAGPRSFVDANATHPLRQCHRMDPEASRHLLDRHSELTTPRDTHNIVTKLARERLGHDAILPGHPPGQARSNVTYRAAAPPTRQPTRYLNSASKPTELRVAPPSALPTRLPCKFP